MVMSVPDPEGKVIELDYELQEHLIASLNLGSPPAWKLIAEDSGLFSDYDIEKIERGNAPSWEVLVELDNKLCNISILCDLLDRCKLFEILALLKDREPVVITGHPSDSLPQDECDGDAMAYVPLGGKLTLECRATGLPPPHFAWFNENIQLPDQTTEILLLENFQLKDEGEYYCCVSQPSIGAESEVYSKRVTVVARSEPPSLIEQPAANVRCCEGEELTLSCVADGHPPPAFQWYLENTLLSAQTLSTLHIPCIGMHHKGNYRCYIKNAAGEVYSQKSMVNVKYVADSKSASERVMPVEKVALIITNNIYKEFIPLIHPINDAITLGNLLTKLGFKVVALQNLTQIEMSNAVKMFCKLLPEGAYGLFYFGGHGFQTHDKYMLPVDAPGPESYLHADSLCEKEVIRDVLNTKPRLFVILLDMCLRVPDAEENPNIHDEVAQVFQFMPKRNLIQGYATTTNLCSYERKTDSNGIYVKHLKDVLLYDEPIIKILDMVGKSISKDAKDVAQSQMPSYSNNVTESFYLNDRICGDEKTEEMFKEMNQVPPDTELTFTKARVVAKVQFVQNCFQNVLYIRLLNLERWDVGCITSSIDMPIKIAKESNGNTNYRVITLSNLQRTRIPLTLSIFLQDPKSKVLIDNGMLEVGLPLIAPNRLWFDIHQTQGLHCNACTCSECADPV